MSVTVPRSEPATISPVDEGASDPTGWPGPLLLPVFSDQPWWSCPMALTIARQVVSQSRQALTHDFISAESNLSHSVAARLARLGARQAGVDHERALACDQVGRQVAEPGESATRCRALACSFFPSATFV